MTAGLKQYMLVSKHVEHKQDLGYLSTLVNVQTFYRLTLNFAVKRYFFRFEFSTLSISFHIPVFKHQDRKEPSSYLLY